MAVLTKSPFPGMNPWLESHWGDVHTRLTTYSCDRLQPQLPAGLRARIEEYVAVESDAESDDPRHRFAPDVRVIERPATPAEPAGGGTVVAESATATEPLIVRRKSEPETLHSIQIVDTHAGHRIVTSIEFLSPANKIGKEGRAQFQAKQRDLLAGGVNLVEIDLLRCGGWVLAVPKGAVPKRYREPYRINVVRGDRQDIAEVYRVSLQDALPTIKIPLRPADQDVCLPLQDLIDMAYVNGRYYEDINYAEAPEPPLSDTEAQWAEQLLCEGGLR
jgi:hypothetical protein